MLDQVDEIGRAKFSKASETVCSRVDGKADIFIFNYPAERNVSTNGKSILECSTYSGTAGATMTAVSSWSLNLGRAQREKEGKQAAGKIGLWIELHI